MYYLISAYAIKFHLCLKESWRTLTPSLRNNGNQYSATLSKDAGSAMEYTRQMTCARTSWDMRWGRDGPSAIDVKVISISYVWTARCIASYRRFMRNGLETLTWCVDDGSGNILWSHFGRNGDFRNDMLNLYMLRAVSMRRLLIPARSLSHISSCIHTFWIKDSLIKEVMMVDFPTPSIR